MDRLHACVHIVCNQLPHVMASYWLQTQQALQGPDGLIKKPVLTTELLQRPPFRFLQDIIAEVTAATGYAADPGPEANKPQDKAGKIRYLEKVFQTVEASTGRPIAADAAKVVAGLQPEQTNAFLQQLAEAAKKYRAKLPREPEQTRPKKQGSTVFDRLAPQLPVKHEYTSPISKPAQAAPPTAAPVTTAEETQAQLAAPAAAADTDEPVPSAQPSRGETREAPAPEPAPSLDPAELSQEGADPAADQPGPASSLSSSPSFPNRVSRTVTGLKAGAAGGTASSQPSPGPGVVFARPGPPGSAVHASPAPGLRGSTHDGAKPSSLSPARVGRQEPSSSGGIPDDLASILSELIKELPAAFATPPQSSSEAAASGVQQQPSKADLAQEPPQAAKTSQVAEQIQLVTVDIQRLEVQLHQNQDMMGKLLTIAMGR